MERKLSKNLFRRFSLISAFIFIIVSFASAADYKFPDTYEMRREFYHVITGSNTDIYTQRPVTADSFLTGRKVRFQIVEEAGAYYFIFINEKPGTFRNEFPMVSEGTYIIKRDILSGNFEQIKIFLNNDPDTFIRIISNGKDTSLELSLCNSMIYSNVLLPADINTLITEPFETIVKLSGYIVDWSILNNYYNETQNQLVSNASAQIAQKLPVLNDSDDGAQEWNGDFVFIATGEPNPAKGFNCSGFVKWVTDGIYLSKTKKLMKIDTLKRKRLEDRRKTLSLLYEEERDPLFGLDWTRNIAITLYELDYPDSNVKLSDIDVRNFPYEIYSEDIGYSVRNLKAILYYLTVNDPGYIYLGSINGDFGKNPVLRQHYHVVMFLPYITPSGNFNPVIYERNKMTDMGDFLNKYSRENIHLVRIKIDENFKLPDLK